MGEVVARPQPSQDALPLAPAEKKQFFQDNAVATFGLDLATITGTTAE